MAASLRRYHRHWPIFSCSTRPAAVSTRIWCEIVGCESSKVRPFTIGILSDCFGPAGGSNELNVASAELPLIERGATLRGRKPSLIYASASGYGPDGPYAAARSGFAGAGAVRGHGDHRAAGDRPSSYRLLNTTERSASLWSARSPINKKVTHGRSTSRTIPMFRELSSLTN